MLGTTCQNSLGWQERKTALLHIWKCNLLLHPAAERTEPHECMDCLTELSRLVSPSLHHTLTNLSWSPGLWGVTPEDKPHAVVQEIKAGDSFSMTGCSWDQPGQTSRCLSCHWYLGARQVKLNCAAEASGFIGISERPLGPYHYFTQSAPPGGFKQVWN